MTYFLYLLIFDSYLPCFITLALNPTLFISFTVLKICILKLFTSFSMLFTSWDINSCMRCFVFERKESVCTRTFASGEDLGRFPPGLRTCVAAPPEQRFGCRLLRVLPTHTCLTVLMCAAEVFGVSSTKLCVTLQIESFDPVRMLLQNPSPSQHAANYSASLRFSCLGLWTVSTDSTQLLGWPWRLTWLLYVET